MLEIIEWINYNNGFFLVILTAVYVIATIVTVRKISKSNKIAQENIKVFTEIENDKSRPVLSFSVELVKKMIVVAKVKNIGPTTASKIKIDTDPELKEFDSGKRIRFLSEVIPSLPPNAELSTVLGTYPEYKEKFGDKVITGFIEYSRIGRKSYREEFNFDLTINEGLSWVTEYTVHDCVKEIEKIRKEISHIASGFKKPVVRILDEKEYQKEEKEAVEKFKEQQKKKRE
ncbi:MAG: hypothetical protein WDZ80_01580 [Candidatus Paceibacterota bacterium]